MFAAVSLLSRTAVRQGFRIRPRTTPHRSLYFHNKYLLHTTVLQSARSSLNSEMRVAIIGQSLFGKEVKKAWSVGIYVAHAWCSLRGFPTFSSGPGVAFDQSPPRVYNRVLAIGLVWSSVGTAVA